MAATVSSVTICSNALLTLGAHTINDFAENTDHARLCANKYPVLRDEMLRKHPWNCAVKRVILAPSSTPPTFGWGYRFTLPGDILRILSVEAADGRDISYRIEGRYLLANVDAAYVTYIWRNDNEASWDTSLIRVMETAMAAELAYAVTGSTSLRDTLKQEVEYLLKQARAFDAQEEPAQELDGFPTFESRFR